MKTTLSASDALRARALLYRTMRAFFETRGFVEIETPLRVRSPGLEVHLDAVPAGFDGKEPRFLITSPEYHCKRALALPEMPRLFTLAKCFRAGEFGTWHHVEFTMLEWYRRDASYDDILADTEALLSACAAAFAAERGGDAQRIVYEDETIDVSRGCERLTTQEALLRHAGLDWRAYPTRDVFAAAADRAGFGPVPADDTWDDVFHRVFLTAVEPKLGRGRPTALVDYPASQGALARLKADDPAVCERFEVYAAGIELCNAFGELVDAEEQRARFVEEQETRARLGRAVHAVDEKLLAAIATLPPSGGIALGIDRLLMLLTGASSLREVLPFGYEAL